MRPLVCLNGVVPAALTFASLVRALPEQHVVLRDLLGYTTDDPPAGPRGRGELAPADPEDLPLAEPAGYSLAAEMADLDAALEELGHPVHLLGYSAGASVALGYATAHPDRIASLTLIEPPWIGNDFDDPVEHQFLARLDDVMLGTPAPQRWAPFHAALAPAGSAVPAPPPRLPVWAPRRVAAGERIWLALRAATVDLSNLADLRGPLYLPVAGGSHERFSRAAKHLAAFATEAMLDVYEGCTHVDPPHVREVGRFAETLRSYCLAGAA